MTKQTFPEGCPRQFPIKAGRGNSIVTMYRVTREKKVNGRRVKYDEFKLPYEDAGKRKFHSFSDYADARKHGNDMIDQHASGEATALTLTNESKAIYTRSQEALRPFGIPLDTAALQMAEILKILDGTGMSPVEAARNCAKRFPAKLPDITVPEVVMEFISAKEAGNRSQRYIEDLKYRLGKFSDRYKANLIRLFERSELQGFLDGLNLSPRSYNNFRTVLITLFEFAKKRKYLPADWNEFDGIETVKDKGGSIEIFTPEELRRASRKGQRGLNSFPCHRRVRGLAERGD